MIALPMPDQRLLRHFPEGTTLAVLDAALAATELALGEEHPAVEALLFGARDAVPPTLLTAHLLLIRTSELRHLLRLYSAAVRRAIGPLQLDNDDDDPF
jgi:hypothetical protein